MKSLQILNRYAVLILIMFVSNSYASNNGLAQPINLQTSADKAKNKNIPIMIFMSSVYCDYCSYIKREFLKPMLKSGDYENKVVIRVIEDDIGDEVKDFNGEIIETGTLSERYNINFTPTAIFVDYQGTELTKRIIGLESEEYYGEFVDEAIDKALSTMQVEKN